MFKKLNRMGISFAYLRKTRLFINSEFDKRLGIFNSFKFLNFEIIFFKNYRETLLDGKNTLFRML